MIPFFTSAILGGTDGRRDAANAHPRPFESELTMLSPDHTVRRTRPASFKREDKHYEITARWTRGLRAAMLGKTLPLLLILGGAAVSGWATPSSWLFATFKDPANEGIFFCSSADGLHWSMLNQNQPILTVPSGQRTRDPFLVRDPHGRGFHLLWTSNHRPRSIGYAHSDDLIHWSEPRMLQVFPADVAVLNVWAPECVWDEARSEWVVFWSSTLPGKFPETAGQVKNDKNHRIWAVTTTDFRQVSPPFLFFDPGYPVIDATIAPLRADAWLMVFKDEREIPEIRKHLRAATGPSPRGPWTVKGEAFTEAWTEGPSLVQNGSDLIVFYDTYKPVQHMSAAVRRADDTWQDMTALCRFPAQVKHGSFIVLSEAEYSRIQAAFGGK